MINTKQPVKDYLSKILKTQGFGYWNGTYGQIATESLWASNSARLPSWYSQHLNAKSLWMGKRICDCIGIDKYARWCHADGSVTYDATTDLNQEMLFDLAKKNGCKWGLISVMPDVPGIMVWKQGHIGVYIGNGKSIESRGGDYGVQIYDYKARPWTHWFYNPYIDYAETGDNMDILVKGSTANNKLLVVAWQKFLKYFKGWDIGTFAGLDGKPTGLDGDFGTTCATLTTNYNKEKGIVSSAVTDQTIRFAFEDMINEILSDRTAINSLKSSVATLTKEKATISAEKTTLASNVSTLNQTVSTLNLDKTTLQTTINKLNETINSLSTAKTALNSTISALQGEKSKLVSDLAVANKTISDLRLVISGDKSADDIEDAQLNAKISELQVSIDELAKLKLEAETKISELISEKSAIESELAELKANPPQELKIMTVYDFSLEELFGAMIKKFIRIFTTNK